MAPSGVGGLLFVDSTLACCQPNVVINRCPLPCPWTPPPPSYYYCYILVSDDFLCSARYKKLRELETNKLRDHDPLQTSLTCCCSVMQTTHYSYERMISNFSDLRDRQRQLLRVRRKLQMQNDCSVSFDCAAEGETVK